MSNETPKTEAAEPTETAKTEVRKVPTIKMSIVKLTRVEMTHLRFREPIDLPSGAALHGIESGEGKDGRAHYRVYWIPEWRQYELVWHQGGDRGATIKMVPAEQVSIWTPA